MKIKESYLRRLIKTLILSEAVNVKELDRYITDKSSEKKFRDYVNDNHPEVAKRIDLGRNVPGITKNSYVRKAWEEVGSDYVKSLDSSKQQTKETSDSKNKKRGDGYVIIGAVTTSGVIKNGLKSFLSKTKMKEEKKEELLNKFDKLPQGHGFAISITSDGQCTGTEFGSYPKADCAQMGIEPGVLRDIDLGPKNEMAYVKYAQKIAKDSAFRQKFLSYIIDKHPSWSKRKYGYELKKTTPYGEIKLSDGRKINIVDKAASKFMIGFVKSEKLEDERFIGRQMRLEKRFLFKNSKTLSGALYGAGTVMKYDLGKIKLAESGLTDAQAKDLCRKFERMHRRELGGGNSPADYCVFRARNVEGGNSWLQNQDGCRTYVIFPSGLSKRLRTSDNCGTFAYRFFGKCMGAGAGLPPGLWNAPTTLVDKAAIIFKNRLMFKGRYS